VIKHNLPVNYNNISPRMRREVREQYIKEQGGACYYCSELLTNEPPDRVLIKPINMKLFPPNFLKYPVHLQHNHKTGMTEGAVHAYCNAAMWQYEGR